MPNPLSILYANGEVQAVQLYVWDGDKPVLWDGSSSGPVASSVSLNDGVSSTIKATIKDLTNSNPLTVAIVDTNGDQIASFGAGLTDAQLRASPVPVSGTLTVNVGLTDAQLRATVVPISGTVTANAGTNLNTSALALESGGHLASLDTKLPSQGQALAAASLPIVLTAAQLTTLTPPAAITGFATETTLGTRLSESDFDTKVGSLTETAPSTDTASSGLNGRLQRIAQRITSLITALGSPFQAGGALGAGSAVIGKVGIDQTTPGTTNLVALAANQSVNLAQVGGTNSVNGGVAGSQSVGGTVASNVAITDNPVNIGAQAVSSEPSAITATRKAQMITDLVGKLITLPYANPENFVSGAITSAMTGTTSISLIAAPGSGLRNYITQITVSNAHASVGTDIAIQDGNGGTTLYTIPASALYGGATVTFPTPLRQPTTNTAIYCANVTTGASTKVSASGYKGI